MRYYKDTASTVAIGMSTKIPSWQARSLAKASTFPGLLHAPTTITYLYIRYWLLRYITKTEILRHLVIYIRF